MINVNIKLIGDLSGLSKIKSLRVEVPESAMINDVIQELIKIVNKEEFKRAVIDEITGNISPNIIVLLNGREVKTLGLNSQLKDNDELVFIPATHGG
ncbi:MAG: MoaD/ThiS family protein [Candidatus Bathyarchaeia archaeon]